MPNERITEALREAYASAPVGVIVYQTIEIIHPGFIDEEDNPTSVRVVRDKQDLVATLEAGAPLDGGQSVTFTAFAFDVTYPPQEREGGLPEGQLVIDNVSREVTRQLELTVGSQEITKMIFREFLSTDLSQPHNVPPMQFDLADVKCEVQRVTARVTALNPKNKRFPGLDYRIDDFPALAR